MKNEIFPQIVIGNQFIKKVTNLIDKAQHTIDIIVFDWRVYPDGYAQRIESLNNSIAKASVDGVRVRALVNNQNICNYLKAHGVLAKMYESNNLLHVKLIIIDSKIIICGSHNYTERAMRANEEVSIIIKLEHDDNELTQYFNNLYPL